MACRDDALDEIERVNAWRELRFVSAALCAVLTRLGKMTPPATEHDRQNLLSLVIDSLDYKEAGIDRSQLVSWWLSHQAVDFLRKQREEAVRAEEEKRAAALAKLSDEERKLLGLK